jgi:5'-3' exonuclease
MTPKRVLLIDNSYYNFYRFFATVSWYKHSSERVKDAEGVAWIDNQTFMNTYEKMWFETITKLCHRFKIQRNNIIFARDGSNIWRYSIYPDYKANRSEDEDDDPYSPTEIFKYTNKHFHSRITGCTVLKDNRAEADDIIAITARYIRAVFPETKIIIITGDHDFLQLSEPNMTEIYQLKGLKPLTVNNPYTMLMIKILAGDPSDNIPASFKGCGKVTAKRLANNPQELKAVLEKKGYRQFNLNRQLIDFDFIPTKIVQSIESLLDNIIL